MLMFFSSCKKEVKKDTEMKIEAEKKTAAKNRKLLKKPRAFKPGEKDKYRHLSLDNLDVLRGESYFNIDTNYIMIRTPVINSKFKHYRTYGFVKRNLKAIIVCISDSQPIAIRGNLGNFLLEEKILFSSIKGQPLNLSNNDSLRVIVLNDDIFSTTNEVKIRKLIESIIYDENTKEFRFNDIRPEETGGGVIVNGP